MIRDTSLEAYQELKRTHKLNHDCTVLFDAIVNLKKRFNRWPTDKEILRECRRIDRSKQWEMSHVNGRRNNLISYGIVKKANKIQCSITGYRVCTWEIIHPQLELS
ncbi:MAG: hypothetical protein AAFY41_13885 [Bacteroidota bacterium]